MKRLMIILTILCTLIPCVLDMQAQELVTPPAGLPEETWRVLYNDYRDVHFLKSEQTLTPDKERLVTFVWDEDQLYVQGMFEDYPDSWIHASILWDKRIVFDRKTLVCQEDHTVEGSKPIYAKNGVEISRFQQRTILDFITNYDPKAKHNYTSDFTPAACIYTLSEDGKSIESEVIFPNLFRVCSVFWHEAQGEDLGFFQEIDHITELPDLDIVSNLRFEQVTGEDHSRDPNSHHAVPAILPPADLPQETWDMIYINYHYSVSTRTPKRPVTFVWDDNTLYVKGIFSDYPECWMKATVEDNIIRFENSQLICEEDLILNSFYPVYAMTGVVTEDTHVSTTGLHQNIYFHMLSENDLLWDSWFELYNNGKILESSIPNYSNNYLYAEYSSIAPVFWYNTKPKEVSYGIDDMDYTGYWGTGFPNVIFPTNVMFKKVSGGINDMTDSAKASDSNTYDLQGRQVNPDHLQPGIYIRNGKKIMAR